MIATAKSLLPKTDIPRKSPHDARGHSHQMRKRRKRQKRRSNRN